MKRVVVGAVVGGLLIVGAIGVYTNAEKVLGPEPFHVIEAAHPEWSVLSRMMTIRAEAIRYR